MPEVLEQPPAITAQPRRAVPRGLTPFDHARAVLAGQKSGSVRRQRAALKAPPPDKARSSNGLERSERLGLLDEQITRTRDALNRKLAPQHRAALLRALCDLLDQQRIARGEPLPGSLKPSGGPARAPAWTEEPAAACGPGTATGGSQAPPPPALEDTSSEVSI